MVGSSPTSSSTSSTRGPPLAPSARRGRADPRRSSRRPWPAGSSDEYGSWNTTWMFLRSARRSAGWRRSRSCAVEAERALVGIEQSQQDARQRRLAAARLADEAEHLAVVDVEVDAVDGAHRALDAAERPAAQRERLDDAARLDEHAHRCPTALAHRGPRGSDGDRHRLVDRRRRCSRKQRTWWPGVQLDERRASPCTA